MDLWVVQMCRKLLLFCASWLFVSCGHCMQTRPSCSIEPYATIEFINFTETNKLTYVQRYYDNKPLGEPMVNIVEAKTAHRYHIPPGYYELGTRRKDGTYQSWQTRADRGKWVAVAACSNTIINMSERKVPPRELKIKSRRSKPNENL